VYYDLTLRRVTTSLIYDPNQCCRMYDIERYVLRCVTRIEENGEKRKRPEK